MASRSASEGAWRWAQSVLGVSVLGSRDMGSQNPQLNEKPEGENHHADQGQGAADASAPELDRVHAAILGGGGVITAEMPLRPPAHAGQRRGADGFRVPPDALQRLPGFPFALLLVHDASSRTSETRARSYEKGGDPLEPPPFRFPHNGGRCVGKRPPLRGSLLCRIHCCAPCRKHGATL